ncbi:MAG: FAD:protein FMN transferase [Synergistaceae bacterium]|jgi:thiamine biosynthesis lipoprotein|nr:FAD:protein FMN transferase [Synergistaceae bacterium]
MTEYTKHANGKRRRVIAAIILTCAAVAAVALRVPGFGMNSRSRDGVAMDTLVSVSVHSRKSADELDRILDGAFELIASLDKKLSMHDASSDISRANAGAGSSGVSVSPEVFGLLFQALRIAEISGGAFDPTVGPLSVLWRAGDRDNPRDEPPDAAEIASALSLVGCGMLSLRAPDEISLEKAGMKLDLGGVAKGYASGAVGNFLKRSGVESALVDLGGNVLALGGRPNGERWRIGVQHPLRRRGEPICSIEIEDSSVITAGVYERFTEMSGRRYTHIFDPRTGRPVEGELLSVTVITDDPTTGDALSTAFMVMGMERAMALADDLGVEAIFLSARNGAEVELTTTNGLDGRVRVMDDEAAPVTRSP